MIPLNQGWNLISLNFTPPEYLWAGGEGADLLRMFRQLRIDEDNHLIWQVKDERGRFYMPGYDEFNTIRYWNLTQGYQVKITEDAYAVWYGDLIPADADVPLEEGWNNIAYFPTYDLDASAPDMYVLSPIIENVLLAKDTHGRFMLPAREFSNMPP